MKRGSRVLLFLVLIIIILVVVAIFVIRGGVGGLLPGQAEPTQAASPMIDIVTLNQPMNRDDQITEEVLGTIPYPQDKVTQKMVTNKQDVIGKYAVYPLEQGAYLTMDMVAERPGLLQPDRKSVV